MKKISNKILYIIAALAAFLLVISAFASERPIPPAFLHTLSHFLCQRLSIHLGDVRGEDLRRKGVWF